MTEIVVYLVSTKILSYFLSPASDLFNWLSLHISQTASAISSLELEWECGMTDSQTHDRPT